MSKKLVVGMFVYIDIPVTVITCIFLTMQAPPPDNPEVQLQEKMVSLLKKYALGNQTSQHVRLHSMLRRYEATVNSNASTLIEVIARARTREYEKHLNASAP